MQHQRLEIIRLNPSGDAKRQIVCLAGRVSVFRARLDEELHLYGEVLSGRPTAERFSVLLDGKSFTAAEHLYIGFESEPFSGDNRLLRQYLTESGVGEADIEPQLLAHGLGGLGTAPCSALNSVQQRMLQFVVALNRSDIVLVLNDPFFDLAETWREKFAQELGEHAWKNRVIVVVTRLSTRPDVWIDNEYVSRIQLERPREKTIGFGGGDLSSAEFMQTLREELKKTAPQSEGAPSVPGAKSATVRRVERPAPILTAVPKAKPFVWQKPVQHALLAASGLLLAIFLLSSPRQSAAPQPTPAPIPQKAPPISPADAHPAPRSEAAKQATAEKLLALLEAQKRETAEKKSGSILELYPAEIKDAVLKAFREPKSVYPISGIQNVSASKPHPVEQKAPSVAAASAPEPAPPDQRFPQSVPLYEPNTIMNPAGRSEEEVEAQRQMLRQHFLEAVARARERQMNESGVLPLQR